MRSYDRDFHHIHHTLTVLLHYLVKSENSKQPCFGILCFMHLRNLVSTCVGLVDVYYGSYIM